MKKMIYLFILVFSLSTLVACSDDEGTPVFTEPTEFVLNVPKYASGIYDLKNTGHHTTDLFTARLWFHSCHALYCRNRSGPGF